MFITRRAPLVAFLVTLMAGWGGPLHPARAAPVTKASDHEVRTRAKILTASEVLSSWVEQQKGQISLVVGFANASEALASIHADQPLNPASNMKLLTMATALKELGPEWRFTTHLCGLAHEDSVETLGIGSNGDPTLDRAAMTDLAYQLVNSGIKRVTRIVVDQSAFDSKYTPPAFEQQPNEWASFRAPVSAVAFNGNTMSIWIGPTLPSQPLRVQPFPRSFMDLVVTARTGPPNGKAVPIAVAVSSEKGGLKLNVSGTLSARAEPVTLFRRVEDPGIFAGYALAETLQALGVSVASPPIIEPGSCSSQPVLARRDSPPLATLLHQLGKDSDNFTAEMLVKAIGAHSTSKPGTTADGIEAIRQFATQIHPLATSTRLVNGSGLFDANRVSAEQFVAVLRYMRAEPRLSPEFIASLAVAGRDGTLRKRLAKPSRVVIRAKTGTLKRVVSLSGIIELSGVEPLVFSVITNEVERADTARRKIDDFVAKVVEAIEGP